MTDNIDNRISRIESDVKHNSHIVNEHTFKIDAMGNSIADVCSRLSDVAKSMEHSSAAMLKISGQIDRVMEFKNEAKKDIKEVDDKVSKLTERTAVLESDNKRHNATESKVIGVIITVVIMGAVGAFFLIKGSGA